MSRWRSTPLRSLVALAACLLAGCAQLPVASLDRAEALAHAQRPSASACPLDPCPSRSDLLDDAHRLAASPADAPQHRLTLLERGDDALIARLHLIRAARSSIELQTYIFVEDDVGWLVLNELAQAARRGVRVRILVDQLFSLDDVSLLAVMASGHRNFETRLFNPTFGKAETGPLEFAAGIVCCFRRFNRRMHDKLLRIDGVAAITGGRNIQARYYDWEPDFNYRDRDLLVLGPSVATMGETFERFWQHPLAVPIERLHDVAQVVLDSVGGPTRLPRPRLDRVERVVAASAMADDRDWLDARLRQPAFTVGAVGFIADGPDKTSAGSVALGTQLRDLVRSAQHSVVLQTPYLVMTKPARRAFRALRRKQPRPEVLVSTNSLAATDAWPVYAISHKYKRTYLRGLGMDIREYKPYPERLPLSLWLPPEGDSRSPDATVAVPSPSPSAPASAPPEWRAPLFEASGSGSGRMGSSYAPHRPVPLVRSGRRTGLHAKSLVIDGQIAVVGSHNFDPRSDDFNTESMVVVVDRAFAEALERIIRIDAAPDNAWVIARRPELPLLAGVNYRIGQVFEWLPVFDLWPFRYHTSYQRRPECPDAEPGPDLDRSPCWQAVGAFPDVDVPFKSLYTRLMTAFGSGLEPIL